MNRLICPECNRPSYCASLTGPIHCSNDDCGALLLPGGDVQDVSGQRVVPRLGATTKISVEYLNEDRRVVEADRPFVDVSIVGISTILDEYPPLGSTIVVELSDTGVGGQAWRVAGIVREVQPGPDEGFRVGIEFSGVASGD